MKITDTHVYFYGGGTVFSNWHPCKFTDPFYKIEFANSEQAFMYYKAIVFHDLDIAGKIAAETNPAMAKKLGREVKFFDAKMWECVGYGYMLYANYLKYSQNKDLKRELLITGDKVLVEASPTDCIWGVGLAEDDPSIKMESHWRGTNLLGKVLMEVRGMLL